MGKIFIYATALCGIALLNACTQVPRPDYIHTPQRQALQGRLQALQHWQLQAGIAAHSDDDGFNARLHWKQRGEAYELRFTAPLGQGVAMLSGNASAVTLRTMDNKTYTAANPDKLLAQTNGMRLPLSHLFYWVRGLAAPLPLPQEQEADAKGRLTRLKQDGWDIEYVRYAESGGLPLPDKFLLQNKDFFVKIVISRWQAGK